MSQPRHPDDTKLPHRVSGNLALDLANTLSFRDTPEEVDHLADVDDILAWAKDARLVGKRFNLVTADSAALAADVHHLRRAVDDTFAAISRGTTPGKAALATIRDIAARCLAGATITGAPATLKFGDAHAIIGPLAWAAMDLLRSDELGRLKQCPPHDCRWLFIDRTKNGSRRWCEMATCGDRAKKNARR